MKYLLIILIALFTQCNTEPDYCVNLEPVETTITKDNISYTWNKDTVNSDCITVYNNSMCDTLFIKDIGDSIEFLQSGYYRIEFIGTQPECLTIQYCVFDSNYEIDTLKQ